MVHHDGDRAARRQEVNPVAGDVSVTMRGETTVILLSGEIDVAIRAELIAAARFATAVGGPVRVDVADLTFMDSAGIAFLAQLLRAGLRPQVVGADRRTIELLELSGIRRALEPDERPPLATHLIGYRNGWAGVELAPQTFLGPWSEVGAGPIHAVPQDNNIALCGAACILLDDQPFTARPGHCRACLLALRARPYS